MLELMQVYHQTTSTGEITTIPLLGLIVYILITISGIYGIKVGYSLVRR